MRRGWLAGLVLFAVPAAGCGPVQKTEPKPKFALEGSLSVVMGLGYDQAHLDLTADALALRFGRTKGEGEDTVFKATANIADLETLPVRAPLDLAELMPTNVQRGVISRDVLDDPRRVFPKLARGRIIFDKLPNPGEDVTGDLAVTFENGTEFASGRTVFGKFEANVQ